MRKSVIAIIVLVVFAVAITFFVLSSSRNLENVPKNVDELMTALDNGSAINCQYKVVIDEEFAVIHQVAAGGTERRISMTGKNGNITNSVIKTGEAFYLWGITNEVNFSTRAGYDDAINAGRNMDGIIAKLDPSIKIKEEKQTISDLSCRVPADMDFSVPDRRWIEVGAYL